MKSTITLPVYLNTEISIIKYIKMKQNYKSIVIYMNKNKITSVHSNLLVDRTSWN